MARRKEKITKRAAVLEFLGKGFPTGEIGAAVKEAYGITVNNGYIANIKSQEKKRAQGGGKSPKAASRNGHAGHSAISAAVEFIRAAGSVEAARRALETVEEIRQLA